MEKIMLEGVSIEYVPRAGYMYIVCELPFISKEGILHVENMIPEEEDYSVTSIELLMENTLKVSLDSGDIIEVISKFKTGNYLFEKVIGDFKVFNAYNIGDDQIKIVTNGDKLGSFELRREGNDSYFSIELFEEQSRYYLIVSEPNKPWQRDEVSNFQFDGKKISCSLRNGDVFSFEIICVPYVADLINNISELLE